MWVDITFDGNQDLYGDLVFRIPDGFCTRISQPFTDLTITSYSSVGLRLRVIDGRLDNDLFIDRTKINEEIMSMPAAAHEGKLGSQEIYKLSIKIHDMSIHDGDRCLKYSYTQAIFPVLSCFMISQCDSYCTLLYTLYCVVDTMLRFCNYYPSE